MIILKTGVDEVIKSIKDSEFQQASKMEGIKQVSIDHYYYLPIQVRKAISIWFKSEVFQQVPEFPQKVVPRFARARMMIYKRPPVRIVDDDIESESSKKYRKNTYQLDSKMREFAEVAWVIKDALLYSFWNEDEKRLQYQVIPIFQEYFTDDDPVNPWAYSYEIGKNAKRDRIWSFWSKEHHFKFDQKGNKIAPPNNPKMKNPYKVLPFTKASNTSGAFDVTDAAIHMGIGATQLALGARFNLGLLWTDGDLVQDDPIKWDMISMLQVPIGSQVGSVTYGGSLQDNIDSIKTFANMTAENNHLRIRWGAEGKDVISGKALLILEIENLDARESDIPLWEGYEDDRFQVDRTILGKHGVTLKENYRVDFAEVQVPQTKEEKQTNYDWELKHNHTTDAQILFEDDPDRFASIDKAQEFIDENRKTNKTNAAATVPGPNNLANRLAQNQ